MVSVRNLLAVIYGCDIISKWFYPYLHILSNLNMITLTYLTIIIYYLCNNTSRSMVYISKEIHFRKRGFSLNLFIVNLILSCCIILHFNIFSVILMNFFILSQTNAIYTHLKPNIGWNERDYCSSFNRSLIY